jgi:hypothetical protein
MVKVRLVLVTIGCILLALGVAILCYDLVQWGLSGAFEFIDVGLLWFSVHPGSLQLAEPAIARHIHPFLWHPVMSSILLVPAFVVFGVPGVILLYLTRKHAGPRHGYLFPG